MRREPRTWPWVLSFQVMRMAAGRAPTLIVLALWVLAGPVGMAFSCCASMCEGSCAIGFPALQGPNAALFPLVAAIVALLIDRKSTRLNSSHRTISYAVF